MLALLLPRVRFEKAVNGSCSMLLLDDEVLAVVVVVMDEALMLMILLRWRPSKVRPGDKLLN